MKNQTAVDWLFEELQGIHPSQIEYLQTFEKAKAMEKEQIEDAYDAGLFDGSMDDVNDRMHKQYYNETYNK
jgi:hypothetical protein